MTSNCNIRFDKNYDVYCGRGKGSKNNPLKCKIGEDGWLGNPIAKGKTCPVCKKIHKNGGETLSCYEKYLLWRLKKEDFRLAFLKLKGKKLACWCKPHPCHTDIMIKFLDK